MGTPISREQAQAILDEVYNVLKPLLPNISRVYKVSGFMGGGDLRLWEAAELDQRRRILISEQPPYRGAAVWHISENYSPADILGPLRIGLRSGEGFDSEELFKLLPCEDFLRQVLSNLDRVIDTRRRFLESMEERREEVRKLERKVQESSAQSPN